MEQFDVTDYTTRSCLPKSRRGERTAMDEGLAIDRGCRFATLAYSLEAV